MFGWGTYSTVFAIKAAREPGLPDAPTTSIDPVTGGIALAWVAPDARGDDITAYKVEIANNDGTAWYTDAACVGTSSTVVTSRACVIPMTTLTSAPYNYIFDDVVYVKVSAQNAFGFGAVSPASASTGARIRSVPQAMAAPSEDPSSTDVTLTLNWVALTGAQAGNSDVIAYSLYWDNGVSAATADIELTDALVTSFTVNGVDGGKPYKFRVRARNIYGYGEYSPAATITPHDLPGKTGIPTVALSASDSTAVEVSWALPNEHSSPITKYEILFMQANGDFVPEPTYCNGAVEPIVTARKCTVPMGTLRTLTLLPRDSLVRVKVRAYNMKAGGSFGQFSEVNTAGATIETEPTNLSVVSIDVPATSNVQTRVTWTALTGSARGGKDVVIDEYEVYWD